MRIVMTSARAGDVGRLADSTCPRTAAIAADGPDASGAVSGAASAAPRGSGDAVLVLVSGATTTVRPDHVGHLIVPKQWHMAGAQAQLVPGKWAMDNGAFSGFDEGAFVRMLERFSWEPGCLFVTAPDVVADAAATLARWSFWSRLIRGVGFAPAFVAQDGLTPERVPWEELGALFIGGSTAYKESAEVRSLCGIAKSRGIWVHWGRVNGKRRYELALKSGADSIDGTGFSMFPDTNIPKAAEWHEAIRQQPELDL
jgi:hypothetical protein